MEIFTIKQSYWTKAWTEVDLYVMKTHLGSVKTYQRITFYLKISSNPCFNLISQNPSVNNEIIGFCHCLSYIYCK